ncbi:unnamed protein product, partial [Allacma fusca]
MKSQKKSKEQYQQLDIAKIKSKHVQKKFREELEKQKEDKLEEEQGVEEKWQEWKRKVKTAAEKSIPLKDKRKHKPWITQEILDLMEERRNANRPSSEYTALNHKIMGMCRMAKNEWYEEKCREVEELEKRHNSREMHTKVKQMMATHKKRRSGIAYMRRKDGKYCVNNQETEEVWISYIQELYGDDTHPAQMEVSSTEEAPRIEMWELRNAVKRARNHKAVGEDLIPVDLIKHLTPEYEKELLKIINEIYNE